MSTHIICVYEELVKNIYLENIYVTTNLAEYQLVQYGLTKLTDNTQCIFSQRSKKK